jgi:hypothetical protein
MKLKAKTSFHSSALGSDIVHQGQEFEAHEALAKELTEAGLAESVGDTTEETAVPAPENVREEKAEPPVQNKIEPIAANKAEPASRSRRKTPPAEPVAEPVAKSSDEPAAE